MRVKRREPEERVAARTDSVGCQEREVSDIEEVGREWIGCGVVCSGVSYVGGKGRYVRELDRRCGERELSGLLLMQLQIMQILKDGHYMSDKKRNGWVVGSVPY